MKLTHPRLCALQQEKPQPREVCAQQWREKFTQQWRPSIPPKKIKMVIFFKKWAKDLNRHFSKEDTQMVKKKHEKMLDTANYWGLPGGTVVKNPLTNAEDMRQWVWSLGPGYPQKCKSKLQWDITSHQSKCLSLKSLLLLLLSHFSRVQLCATPLTAAYQAPLSLGFSRQEYWSGLPFPSPMHESEKSK